MNKQITDHFSWDGDKNIICPCCGRIKITDLFWRHMELLEQVRLNLDVPIIITSGYRCESHNAYVKGSDNSWHMKFATDVRPTRSGNFKSNLAALKRLAIEAGFKGIGSYVFWIHLDLRPDMKIVEWEG